MNAPAAPRFGPDAFRATCAREFLSYRINRFLYLHLGLMLVIGVLALLAPPEAATTGAAWWVLNGVIYVASLSALLLGLSSAQSEAEELAFLFTQPVPIRSWVAGKCAGLASVLVASAGLLVLPALAFAGGDGAGLLLGAAAAAAGVTVLMSWLGLALGLWIVDPVRGLISALAVWCVLLFGIDLLLILVGGATWVHEFPAAWVAVLMASPLDAYRVMLLFVLERAAFSGAQLHPLTQWWLGHPALWLSLCLAAWGATAAALALAGARRRRTR